MPPPAPSDGLPSGRVAALRGHFQSAASPSARSSPAGSMNPHKIHLAHTGSTPSALRAPEAAVVHASHRVPVAMVGTASEASLPADTAPPPYSAPRNVASAASTSTPALSNSGPSQLWQARTTTGESSATPSLSEKDVYRGSNMAVSPARPTHQQAAPSYTFHALPSPAPPSATRVRFAQAPAVPQAAAAAYSARTMSEKRSDTAADGAGLKLQPYRGLQKQRSGWFTFLCSGM
ncbi:hypothetical protein THASP1DRAFT_29621 [Thamnocephalis sphaerospora]|uniref:Uncharacterized protein n=1 Tax=Thamnocephalis sphaerospora TaxID=78915 RepID=A0A4P9XR68_9FUNG|nr:hypothetical protein THASP1DRAFT_29621 [Thamnocephalis sphaerospora]|eukprot:RKP08573.1 hypothetical protein THASP1DRAFT_29621 [Thamnocephalis sphaerospora]